MNHINSKISIYLVQFFQCFESKMNTKNILLFFFASNCILATCALLKNSSTTVNVLAAVFPPFTNLDSNHKLVNGIDVQIVNIMTNRLDVKLELTKTDTIAHISTKDLK